MKKYLSSLIVPGAMALLLTVCGAAFSKPTSAVVPLKPAETHTAASKVVAVAATPTGGPAEAKVMVVVRVRGLNVRSGPGLAYPILGHLGSGDEAEVVGFHPDSGWLQIVFEEGPGGQGWISGKEAYVTIVGSLDAVPVVEAPLLPTPGPEVEKAGPEVPAATEGPLGGKLVFQTSSGGDIYTINADGTNLTRLTDGLDPAWSPDGSQVAFARWYHPNGGLYVVNADGSGERLVFGDPQAKAPTWSPDGTRIAFTRQHEGILEDWTKYYKVPIPGTDQTLTLRFKMPADPWWKLGVVRLDDSHLQDLYCHDHSFSPTWSPDGEWIVYASDKGLYRTREEDVDASITRDPNKGAVTQKLNLLDSSPAWSPDGQRLAFQFRQHDHYEIYVINSDGSGRRPLTSNPALANPPVNSVAPAWSPDGQHIVYLTDKRGRWELFVMRADGREQRPMFEEGVLDHLPFEYHNVSERVVSWGSCPGGCQATAAERATAIALMTATPWTPTPTPVPAAPPAPTPTFAPPTPIPTPTIIPTPPLEGRLVFRVGGGDIYTIQADGTKLTRLTDGLDPVWSPDGSQVAFTRWRDPKGVYVINADGGGERLVYGWDQARTPDWSPEGTTLVFTRQHGQDPDSQSQLSVCHLDGSNFVDLFCHGRSYSPAWAPDGSLIIYASNRGLHRTSLELSAQGATIDLAGLSLSSNPGDGAPAWSPDGQRVAFHTWQHDHYEIYVMNSNGEGRLRLTESPIVTARPVNSASPTWVGNDHLAYLTDRSGHWELYVMRAEGSGQRVMFETALEGLTFEQVSLFDRVLDWTP